MIQANQAADEARDLADAKQQALDELDQANGKLAATNTELEGANVELAANLRTSMISEAQALIDRRAPGYKTKVYGILKQLVDKDIPEADRVRLRDMAAACLGDPSALDPIHVLDDFEGECQVDRPDAGWEMAGNPTSQSASLADSRRQRKNRGGLPSRDRRHL